jgi:biotin carboxyl carrier protein
LVAAAALASLPGPPEVLPGVPAGWRNNPSQPTIVVVGGHQVAINRGRDGTSVAVDGIEVDDLPRADDVVLIDGTALFPSGHRPLEITPRFISPQDAVGAGSTVAPMPGVVVRLLVADGESVAAGDSLLTIEAMKMEHRVVAAIDGIVEAILVAPGEQVAAGQVVIRLGAV